MPLRVISRVSFGFGVIFGENCQKGENQKIWAKQVPMLQRRELTPRRRPTLQTYAVAWGALIEARPGLQNGTPHATA